MKTIEHKHAGLLRAIADGKDIQLLSGHWYEADHVSLLQRIGAGLSFSWRIKPEKKPNQIEHLVVALAENGEFYIKFCEKSHPSDEVNLQLVFDGDTRQLIKVEIIK